MKVLLIDDNEELRGFLALTLSESDVEVVAVGAPDEALKRAEAEKFDAFVVDSILQNGDGLSLLAQLRATKNGAKTPALLMSGISTGLARRIAQNAGCDEFLVKPFGTGQFVEQVKGLARVKR